MKKSDTVSICVTAIYASLLILFGFIAFYVRGSSISLFSGGGFGALLLGCAYGMKKNLHFYRLGALGLTTLLMAFFFFRAIASHRIVPTVFGSLTLCVFLVLFYRAARK